MKKLSLNKEVISNLTNDEMNQIAGGIDQLDGNTAVAFFTTGCTDGCTGPGTLATAWRCTKADCTRDCALTVTCFKLDVQTPDLKL